MDNTKKLFCCIDKGCDDVNDVSATHIRANDINECIFNLVSEHYGFGDVEYAEKVFDIDKECIKPEYAEEVESEYGFMPNQFSVTNYEIFEVTI